MINKPDLSNEACAMESAVLNLLSYLEFKSNRNAPIGDIVKKATGDPQIVDILQVYLKDNPALKNMIMIEQSRDVYHPTPKVRYNTKGFNAYTFKKPNSDNYTIVYRGTSKGGWIQNGVAFGPPQNNTYYSYEKGAKDKMYIVGERVVKEHLSTVQAFAINYFNYNAVKYNWNVFDTITVTGHSQGDCNAKLVTLTSPLVNACYGFNGPNFSRETISELQINRELYEIQSKKINLYRTENDQVSIFGYEVVEDNQIYYLEGRDSLTCHRLDQMLSYIYDENGNKKIGFNEYREGRSFFATTLKKYNDTLMELPVEIRGAVTIGAMWFVQNFYIKDKSVFDDHVELWNICLAVVTSGIIIPKAIIQAVVAKYGAVIKYIAAILMGFISIRFTPTIMGTSSRATVVSLKGYAIDKMVANGLQFEDVTNKLVDLLIRYY